MADGAKDTDLLLMSRLDIEEEDKRPNDWIRNEIKKRVCKKYQKCQDHARSFVGTTVCFCGYLESDHTYKESGVTDGKKSKANNEDATVEDKDSTSLKKDGSEETTKDEDDQKDSDGEDSVHNRNRSRSPTPHSRRNIADDSMLHPPDPRQEEEFASWLEHSTGIVQTDAYGEVEFAGYGSNKAKYVRLDAWTDMDKVVDGLLLDQWKMDKPNMLISIFGGIKNIEMDKGLQEAFSRGLIRTARNIGAWFITSGLYTGINKQVGQAVKDYNDISSTDSGNKPLVTIGIASWGCVNNRKELITDTGEETVKTYHITKSPSFPALQFPLDPNHSHFLLVDDGTQGQFGRETKFRELFTTKVSKLAQGGVSIPTIAVLVEGGKTALYQVHDMLLSDIPVVVMKGTGRTADVLASVEDPYDIMLKIEAAYGSEFKYEMLDVVSVCFDFYHLLYIYDAKDVKGFEGLDDSIAKALIASSRNIDTQLQMSLLWNRCDLAKTYVFTADRNWPIGYLDGAMETALLLNRPEFVKIFLDHGVVLSDFLTKKKMEELYEKTDSALTGVLYKKLLKESSSLREVGLLMEDMLGDFYRSPYVSKEKQKCLCTCIKNRSKRNAKGSKSGGSQLTTSSDSLDSHSQHHSDHKSDNDRKSDKDQTSDKYQTPDDDKEIDNDSEYNESDKNQMSDTDHKSDIGKESDKNQLSDNDKLFDKETENESDKDHNVNESDKYQATYDDKKANSDKDQTIDSDQKLAIVKESDKDQASYNDEKANSDKDQTTDTDQKAAIVKESDKDQTSENDHKPVSDQLSASTISLHSAKGQSSSYTSKTSNQGSTQSIEDSRITLQSVRDASKYWYRPHISRTEAVALLENKTPGSFVIRDSKSYSGAFGLVVKVTTLPQGFYGNSDDQLVRHFLIEAEKGVHLKGTSEPEFSSLPQFVHRHCHAQMALPCKLVLPREGFTGSLASLTHSQSATPPALLKQVTKTPEFDNPFLHLFIWAVLTGRQEMAKVFWIRAQNHLPLALVANSLSIKMAEYTENLESWRFESYAEHWNCVAKKLLGKCPPEKSEALVTRANKDWSDASCMQIAFEANNRSFLAEPACRAVLTSVWTGGLALSIPFYSSESGPRQNNKQTNNGSENKRICAIRSLLSRWFQHYVSFFRAPIIRFYYNVMFYVLFLGLFAYILLVEDFEGPVSVCEGILIACVVSCAVEEVRQVLTMQKRRLKLRFRAYMEDGWNRFDIGNILLFFWGLFLRLYESSKYRQFCHLLWAMDFVGFSIRLLHTASVHQQLGPKLVMMKKMLRDLAHFLVIWLVFVMSYAVATFSLLYPQSPLTSETLLKILQRPYWNIYGELFLEEIEGDTNCTHNRTLWMTGVSTRCPTEMGSFVVPIMMAFYMLVVSVLLLNLLIAMFSYTFQRVQNNQKTHWAFQTCTYFYTQIFIAPPLIFFIHMYWLLKWLVNKCRKTPIPLHRDHLKRIMSQKEGERYTMLERDLMMEVIRQETGADNPADQIKKEQNQHDSGNTIDNNLIMDRMDEQLRQVHRTMASMERKLNDTTDLVVELHQLLKNIDRVKTTSERQKRQGTIPEPNRKMRQPYVPGTDRGYEPAPYRRLQEGSPRMPPTFVSDRPERPRYEQTPYERLQERNRGYEPAPYGRYQEISAGAAPRFV